MASKLICLPFFCVLFFLFSQTKGNFGNEKIKRLQGCHKGSKGQGLHELKQYLASYGYLNYHHTLNQTNAEDEEFDEKLEEALKSYQKFYHFNTSGTLDEPTVSQMLMPRCGQPDKEIHEHGTKLLQTVSHFAFFPNKPKWPSGITNLTYAFDSKYPKAYVAPIVRAFDTWASGSGYFTFTRVADFEGADLQISFEKTSHGDGNDFREEVLAHAFSPTVGMFHFNADINVTWSVGPGPVLNAVDLETLALHEIGHLLGLHHSEDPKAVMWSIIPIGVVKGLHSDDIKGIKVLYGQIDCN